MELLLSGLCLYWRTRCASLHPQRVASHMAAMEGAREGIHHHRAEQSVARQIELTGSESVSTQLNWFFFSKPNSRVHTHCVDGARTHHSTQQHSTRHQNVWTEQVHHTTQQQSTCHTTAEYTTLEFGARTHCRLHPRDCFLVAALFSSTPQRAGK